MCPFSTVELHVATDRKPAGADGGGYADQRRFGPAPPPGRTGSTTRCRSAASPCPQATSASTAFTGLFPPIACPPISSSGSNCSRARVRSSTVSPPAAASAAASTSSPSARGEIPFTRVTPFFMSAGNYGAPSGEQRPLRRKQGVGRSVQRRWAQWRSLDRQRQLADRSWCAGRSTIAASACAGPLDAISQNDDTKNFRPQMGIQTTVPFIPVVPDARSNWYPGTVLKQRDNTIATAAEYDISEVADGLCRDRLSRGRELPDVP